MHLSPQVDQDIPVLSETCVDHDHASFEASLSNMQAQEVINHNINAIQTPSVHARDAGVARTHSLVISEGVIQSHSGDVDTGYLQVYAAENEHSAGLQGQIGQSTSSDALFDPRKEELRQSFVETYFEYCYTWCPVLDADMLTYEMRTSPMLANAVSLAASNIRPPLVGHEGSATYYERARTLFYNDEETDGLTALKALSLFYWWAPRAPSIAHRHSSWWWTSVIIRHAQQMNIHREPTDGSMTELTMSLRRRIWWTAFARERLTALCQSKPCIIDEDDCTIGEVRLSDFPADATSQRKGLIFMHWVRLCAIMGRIAKRLLQSDKDDALGDLRQELMEWAMSLPAEIRLQIGSARTVMFDRDVHQLHLPYLTTIIILHLKRSPHDLPQALPPAILAASCVSRLLRDILTRGNARFLMAITCWYTGVAMIPLLQATRIKQFKEDALDGIGILVNTIEQLQKMWGSADVIRQGFDRLLKTMSHETAMDLGRREDMLKLSEAYHVTADNFDWSALFPFVTKSTNAIAECLLKDKAQGAVTRGFASPTDMLFYDQLLNQYNGFIDPLTDYDFEFTNFAL